MKTTKELLNENFTKKITFNEELHKYYVDSNPLSISASGVIGNFYESFETKKIAKSISKSLLDIVSQNDVLASWDELCEIGQNTGTKTHIFGEFYPFDRSLTPENNQEIACKNYWDNMPKYYKPLIMEQRMYHFKYMFGGTADITLFNEKTGNILLGDYKTNKDLFKNFGGKMMLSPFEDMLDMPFSHYVIQLNIYKILLEQVEGIIVEGMQIIWLRRNKSYQMYSIPDITDRVKKALDNLYKI